MSERRGRIHEKHELSKTRRCGLLDVARSSAYYRRESVSEADLAVMRLIDEIHLQLPFYGSRRMRDELEERGHTVTRTPPHCGQLPLPHMTIDTNAATRSIYEKTNASGVFRCPVRG